MRQFQRRHERQVGRSLGGARGAVNLQPSWEQPRAQVNPVQPQHRQPARVGGLQPTERRPHVQERTPQQRWDLAGQPKVEVSKHDRREGERGVAEDVVGEEQRRLKGLRTVNSLDRDKTDTRAEDREKYSAPIVHPMVRTHPVHGSNAIYFHVTKTLCIEGMTPEASRAYLNDLLDRMIRPEIIYQHRWRKGDVLVIDNRATMHRAHGDYDRRQSRVLWRIIVEGDRPRLN